MESQSVEQIQVMNDVPSLSEQFQWELLTLPICPAMLMGKSDFPNDNNCSQPDKGSYIKKIYQQLDSQPDNSGSGGGGGGGGSSGEEEEEFDGDVDKKKYGGYVYVSETDSGLCCSCWR
ncbi:hypothetical protein C5167_036471 [Papaver somniferum]|uniref:Uncharacterized protein n=1 Tax=Papaver somniferum TaxID=3469 RepID=A0A4Y7I3U7_PAPSO|nr:hypothetical protein C5167_036471 [Papaver somniferum]